MENQSPKMDSHPEKIENWYYQRFKPFLKRVVEILVIILFFAAVISFSFLSGGWEYVDGGPFN